MQPTLEIFFFQHKWRACQMCFFENINGEADNESNSLIVHEIVSAEDLAKELSLGNCLIVM